MLPTKPMLSGKVEDLKSLKYPLIGSPKLDGIRCLIIKGHDGKPKAVTRNWKPIPNEFTRQWLEANCKIGLDGELMVRDAFGANAEFSNVSSGIMAEDGKPDFYYACFDYVKSDVSAPFVQRIEELKVVASPLEKTGHLKIVPQIQINTTDELRAFLDKCIAEGFEGVMVRSPDSPYKEGRATEKEGWLLKIKLFDDAEAIIEDMIPLMHNENEATKDAFGRTERSSKKEGLVEMNWLGALSVKDIKTGVQFEIGTGFTQAQREEFWANRKKLIGKMCKYKFQGLGVNGRPRFPVFIGLRDERDM